MVADSDELREFFRDQFAQMTEALEDEDAPSPFRSNNRNQISWEGGARLLFQTSGVRTGNRLGVGRGFAFCHAMEVGLWSKAASMTYLRTRFSEKHPQRLFIAEGTARGKNFWYDLWTDAESSSDIKRIFLASWMREDNTVQKDSKEYKEYWDGKLTHKERRIAFELDRRYQTELTPGQWAWRRWYHAEKAGNDDGLAGQEMPTLPEEAFEASGESFLGHELIQRCRVSVKKGGRPSSYRYEFGSHLEETEVKKTTMTMAELLVW
jgi:hypothetical protein